MAVEVQGSGASNPMFGQALGINQNLAQIAQTLRTAFPLSATHGTFTCAAATSTVVTNANVKAASFIAITPTNQAAATLMQGANALYVSARAEGVSFTVAGTGAAAGTETFMYLIVNTG